MIIKANYDEATQQGGSQNAEEYESGGDGKGKKF